MHGRAFGVATAWELTRLNHEAYLDREKDNLSPYTCIDGFDVQTVSYDWLHNVNLGCGRDMVGSGIRLLAQKGIWGPVTDRDATLNKIHMEIHRACAAEGSLGHILSTKKVCACLAKTLPV